MKPAVKAVLDQIAALPPEDRAAVAWGLELQAPRRPFTEAETAEFRRRVEEVDAGRATLLDHGDVMTDMRRLVADMAAEEKRAAEAERAGRPLAEAA